MFWIGRLKEFAAIVENSIYYYQLCIHIKDKVHSRYISR